MRRYRSALSHLVVTHVVMASMKYPLLKIKGADVFISDDRVLGLHLKVDHTQNSVVILSENDDTGDVRVEFYRTNRAFDARYNGVTLSGPGLRADESEEHDYMDMLLSDSEINQRFSDLGEKLLGFLQTGKIKE